MIGKVFLILLLIGLHQIAESADAPSTNCANFREVWRGRLQMPQPSLFKSSRRQVVPSKEKLRRARSIRAKKIEMDLKKNWKPYTGDNLLMENCLGLTMIESGDSFKALLEDLHKQSLPRLELCLAMTFGLQFSFLEANHIVHVDVCTIIERIFNRVNSSDGKYLRFPKQVVLQELARASHLSHCPNYHLLILKTDDAGRFMEFLLEDQSQFINQLSRFLPEWYRSGNGRDSRIHRAIFNDASPLAITSLRRACLTAASSTGNLELIKEIISLGMIHPQQSHLCEAAQSGNLDAFVYLNETFHLTLDHDSSSQGCIMNIISKGHLHIIDWILQHSSSMTLRRQIVESTTDFMGRIDLFGSSYVQPSAEHSLKSTTAYNLLQRHQIDWPCDFVDRLCGYGHVAMVNSIYREHPDKFTYRCGEFAATTNNIGVVRWISTLYRSPCAMFSPNTLDWACYHGNLEMIEILSEYRIVPSPICGTLAAINGHHNLLRVMEEELWLSLTPPDARWMVRAGVGPVTDGLPVTNAALRTAARYGRLQYISRHQNHLFSDSSLSNEVYNDALEQGNVQVADYVLSLGLTVTPLKTSLMSGATKNIHFLRWIFEHQPLAFSDVDLKSLANHYVKSGMLDQLKLIIKERGVLPDEKALDEAVYGRHLPIVLYVTAAPWKMRYSQEAADYIAELGLIDFLIIDRSKGPREDRIVVRPSTSGFDKACAQGRLAFLKLAVNPAFGHVPSWVGANLAAENGHQHVLQWLFDRLGMLPTAEGSRKALSNGHYSIVSWLQKRHKINISCDQLKDTLILYGNAEMLDFVTILFPDSHECFSEHLDILIEVAIHKGNKLLVDRLLQNHPQKHLDRMTRLLLDTWTLSFSPKPSPKSGIVHRVISFLTAFSSWNDHQSIVTSYIAKMRNLKGIEEVANSINYQDIPV